eukprot:UN08876
MFSTKSKQRKLDLHYNHNIYT